MAFKPIQKLDVSRTLTNGQSVKVGVLAQNRQGVFFQYNETYWHNYGNLSPFKLKPDNQLQIAPDKPHGGLHGVFADSLPDGWGLLLQDRVFRQQGILPAQVSAMDRLAFVGQSAIGALTYSPQSRYAKLNQENQGNPKHSGNKHKQKQITLAALGLQAQSLFDDSLDGDTDEVLAALVTAGSSGGARPKAQVYLNNDLSNCRMQAHQGDKAWLVKFTSKNLALGHEEGLCEAAYLTIAENAQLSPPQWQLLNAPVQSGASRWLAIKRFDWVDSSLETSQYQNGRLHMHSACGLLDADFRSPSLDYEDLIKASRILCKSPAAGQLQFRRAIFNLFACNQDDHSKNWAFLQDDTGSWQLAPFYDVTFSPTPYAEHSTSFAGFGKKPPLKAIQKLAAAAGFANWKLAQEKIKEIVEEISIFGKVAKSLGVKLKTINLIEKQLNQSWQNNRNLLAPENKLRNP